MEHGRVTRQWNRGLHRPLKFVAVRLLSAIACDPLGKAKESSPVALGGALLLAAGASFEGCGGGGAATVPPPPPPPPSIVVKVTPASGTVLLGNRQSFTAEVSNAANTSVAWSVNGIASGNSFVGIISPAGLYTAPVGDDASSALTDTSRFAVTQDQRNTLRARIRLQSTKKTWLAVSAEYGSSLPVELDTSTVDINFLME